MSVVTPCLPSTLLPQALVGHVRHISSLGRAPFRKLKVTHRLEEWRASSVRGWDCDLRYWWCVGSRVLPPDGVLQQVGDSPSICFYILEVIVEVEDKVRVHLKSLI